MFNSLMTLSLSILTRRWQSTNSFKMFFPSLEEHAKSAVYMSSRAILSTKNEHIDRLNAMMIERFLGEEKVYHSFDTVVDDP